MESQALKASAQRSQHHHVSVRSACPVVGRPIRTLRWPPAAEQCARIPKPLEEGEPIARHRNVASSPSFFLTCWHPRRLRDQGVGEASSMISPEHRRKRRPDHCIAVLRGQGPKNQAKLDEAYIQAKLVVVSPEEAAQLVPNISRFANSQNKVNEADFFSNSPFHVRLEELSRRILTPPRRWVHVPEQMVLPSARVVSMPARKTSSGRRHRTSSLRHTRRARVITKTDAAKYVTSWDRQPHKVSAGAQKNFVAFADKSQRSGNPSTESFCRFVF